MWRSSCTVKFFLRNSFFISTFKRFFRNIAECLQGKVHLLDTFTWNLQLFFHSRSTPNNNFLDVTNKGIKKVMWHCCWSLFIMNLKQLIFTWRGWDLVLSLFVSIYRNPLYLNQQCKISKCWAIYCPYKDVLGKPDMANNKNYLHIASK